MGVLLLFLLFRLSAAVGNTNTLIQQFLTIPSNSSAASHLYNLTQQPHLAGSPLAGNIATIDYVFQKFEEYGLIVSKENFTSLVNYPVERSVKLISPTQFTLNLTESALPEDPTSGNPDAVMTFNGYGASGNVTAEVVYANYGGKSDFDYLTSINVSVAGKIVIVRYGANYRGVKVQQAQIRGAIGVLIYSDPWDDGNTRGDVYPNGPYRPSDGVQRGSCLYMQICPGDPRRTQECLNDANAPYEGNLIPAIPVTPISYGDAQPILQNLAGPDAPPTWVGGLPITYKIGPGPSQVNLYVNNTFEVRTMVNVIGKIQGSEVPDEQVIFGNHRDAWVFGAFDPSSGTAAMLETARGFGQLLSTGWRPKRTIIFASWDGEEYGLLGSTAYAEAHADELKRTVTYLNVDVAVTGSQFVIEATPSLSTVIYKSTDLLMDPKTNENLTYVWGQLISPLGSGSDYTPFIHHFGVPSLSYTFSGPQGVYHSIYDSYTWMSNWGDPGFRYHRLAAQFFGAVGIGIIDATIAPIWYNDTAKALRLYLNQTKQSVASYNPTPFSFAPLDEAVAAFAVAAEDSTTQSLDSIRENLSATKAQPVNQYLYETERLFLDSNGLPSRFWYKHTLQAPGITKGYGSDVFPGLAQAIENKDWTLAASQVNAISARINAAANHLKNSSDDKTGLIVGLTVGLTVAAVLAVLFACRWFRNKKKHEGVDLGKGYDTLDNE